MSHSNSARNSEPKPQTKNILDLHQAFARLSFAYGMFYHDDRRGSPAIASLVSLELQCDRLAAVAQAMRSQVKGGAE